MPRLRVRDIHDHSIKDALRLALADDKRISITEAYGIIEAALDKNGISRQERKDLRHVFGTSKTIDASVRREVLAWLDRCDRLSTRLRYSSVSRNYGGVPAGWVGSAYDTGGAGEMRSESLEGAQGSRHVLRWVLMEMALEERSTGERN